MSLTSFCRVSFEGQNTDKREISETHPKNCSNLENGEIQTEEVEEESSSNKNRRFKDLSKRKDVIGKTLLRAVRRFFMRKFKLFNRRIIRKRIINVSPTHLAAGTKKMCESVFDETAVGDEFVLFMQTFLNLKPNEKSEEKSASSKRANEVLDCLNNFSMAKYAVIKWYKEVKAMIQVIHNKYMEEIFEKEKSFRREKESYVSAIREYLN